MAMGLHKLIVLSGLKILSDGLNLSVFHQNISLKGLLVDSVMNGSVFDT